MWVGCDRETIAMLLRLEDSVEIPGGFDTSTNVDLDDVLRVIAKRGAEWKVKDGQILAIKRDNLNYRARVWFQFISSRCSPTTNHVYVPRERVLLLYAILSGRPVDICGLLVHMICKCAEEKGEKLWFPSLLTDLCRCQRVYTDNADKNFPAKGPIYRALVRKMRDDDENQPSVPPQPQRHQTKGKAKAAASSIQPAAPSMMPQELSEFIEYQVKVNRIILHNQQRLASIVDIKLRQHPPPPSSVHASPGPLTSDEEN